MMSKQQQQQLNNQHAGSRRSHGGQSVMMKAGTGALSTSANSRNSPPVKPMDNGKKRTHTNDDKQSNKNIRLNDSNQTNVSITSVDMRDSMESAELMNMIMTQTKQASKTASQAVNQTMQQPTEQARLPSIKVQLTEEASRDLGSSVRVAQEIMRLFPNLNFKTIKFAKVTANKLVIATDDKATHDALSGEWPIGAFNGGARLMAPRKPEVFELIIKGLHPAEDFNNSFLIEQFKEQGITTAKRITNSHTNKPTNSAKLTVESKEAYERLLVEKVWIGFCPFKPEPIVKVLQCFNCQQFGHTKATCKNEIVCLRCSGKHTSKECQSNTLKCNNCGGKHATCARNCPKMMEATESAIAKKVNPSQQPQRHATQTVNSQTVTAITHEVSQALCKLNFFPKSTNFAEVLKSFLIQHTVNTEQPPSLENPQTIQKSQV
jgi:hypothetical protein